MIKIGINGLGRIGRNFLRLILQDNDVCATLHLVVINIGPAKKDFIAHMIKHDTLMGKYPGKVAVEDDVLIIDNNRISLVAEKHPRDIMWGNYGVDWVVEASGHYTSRERAQEHIDAGARRVLITAPGKNEDVMIVPGVNDAAYQSSKHTIVSLGSCTTNAFLVILKVLHDHFTIEHGLMTTVHAYTNSQVLLDREDSDLRRSRAAALNIIPTTTGAMKTIDKVLPELSGRIDACALRVPVAKISLIDLSFTCQKKLAVDDIHHAFYSAKSEGIMSHILGVEKAPLVSSDFYGDERSVVIDSTLTMVVGARMGKIFGWYDNEWGYSARLRDFLLSVS